jgi:hypothetical protein
MSTSFETPWEIGDRVYVDGDTSIKGVVSKFTLFPAGACYAGVEWFHNGDAKSGEFNLSRLSKADR